MSTNSGRVYKSKDGERLILYFKDLNLVKPDKWGTCQLVEFLQQVITQLKFEHILIFNRLIQTEFGRNHNNMQ